MGIAKVREAEPSPPIVSRSDDQGQVVRSQSPAESPQNVVFSPLPMTRCLIRVDYLLRGFQVQADGVVVLRNLIRNSAVQFPEVHCPVQNLSENTRSPRWFTRQSCH